MPATIAGSTVMPVDGRSSVTQFGLMRIVSSVSKWFSAWMSLSTLVMSRGSVVEWSEILGTGMNVCLIGLVLLFLVLVHGDKIPLCLQILHIFCAFLKIRATEGTEYTEEKLLNLCALCVLCGRKLQKQSWFSK